MALFVVAEDRGVAADRLADALTETVVAVLSDRSTTQLHILQAIAAAVSVGVRAIAGDVAGVVVAVGDRARTGAAGKAVAGRRVVEGACLSVQRLADAVTDQVVAEGLVERRAAGGGLDRTREAIQIVISDSSDGANNNACASVA